MRDDHLLILGALEVESILAGNEMEILAVVRSAYEAHHVGLTSLPHSQFLRFPDSSANRIMSLPAYIGGPFEAAGMKWVSSFPGNLRDGLDRVSAVLILNSPATGRPVAIMEGSIINAKRTAASACLAADALMGPGAKLERLSLLGCGPVNYEIVRFLNATHPELSALAVYDIDVARAEHFRYRIGQLNPGLRVELGPDARAVLRNAAVISIATTAIKPHISDISGCAPGAVILHVSLRDIAPEVLLRDAENIVDDVDHVCRAGTSLHLAEQIAENRTFITSSLPAILAGVGPARLTPNRPAVFSPFGLGILDVALATHVRLRARAQGLGTEACAFLPASWDSKAAAAHP